MAQHRVFGMMLIGFTGAPQHSEHRHETPLTASVPAAHGGCFNEARYAINTSAL
jgi:hypothetical protein